jgi:DNA-binding transcriptional regulator GbsR (MarR family)
MAIVAGAFQNTHYAVRYRHHMSNFGRADGSPLVFLGLKGLRCQKKQHQAEKYFLAYAPIFHVIKVPASIVLQTDFTPSERTALPKGFFIYFSINFENLKTFGFLCSVKLSDAKKSFIQTWARLGAEWGINRTMAQVHALLLATDGALTTDEVMGELNISRGNANMNLRELLNWNLVYREAVPGDRKEYFRAEKDVWEVAKRIARERKRREIEPLLRELSQMENVSDDTPEAKQFVKTVRDIHGLAGKIDKSVETMLKADENWFFGAILKLLR